MCNASLLGIVHLCNACLLLSPTSGCLLSSAAVWFWAAPICWHHLYCIWLWNGCQSEKLDVVHSTNLPEKVDFIANSFELDPYILYALMRAESSFNPVAVSQVGARGIMQMMPYTAVRLSKLLGDESFSLDELNDPNHAIYYGSAYFKLLLEAFDQNLVAAIAAYNAGPKAVNSWLRSCTTHCNIDDFVELIPFKETRLYVKKVLRNYAAYKDLYEQEEVFQELPRVPKESRPDFTVF